MHTLDVTHDFDAPAAALWDILVDFGHIERWWPVGNLQMQIDKVVLEGEGIGLTRHIYNVGFPNAISERLDFLDHDTRTLKLSIIDAMPADLTYYQATGRVDILPGNRCRLVYHGDYLSSTGSPEQGKALLLGAYQMMFAGLADALVREASQAD
jgi:hypothetical protein